VPKIESFALVFNTGQAGKFIEIGKSISGKMYTMLGKMDLMLEKQDETISILKSVKEDTSAIKRNTESLPEMGIEI